MAANLFAQLNSELGALIQRVQASVVEVRAGREGRGAGTIWHADGLVVTNAHVARSGPLEVALRDGRTFRAQIIARDDERDLAALALEGVSDGLPVITAGSARRLAAGQWVLAVGHPWGIRHAVTGGVVIGRAAGERGADWVVVDLQLRPGNSGGPLVDTDGRLIGVNTIMTGPQVGAAVSVDAAKAFLKQHIGLREAAVV